MAITPFGLDKVETQKQSETASNGTNLVIYLGIGHEQTIKNILTYICTSVELLQNKFKSIFVYVHNGQNIDFKHTSLTMLDYTKFCVNHLEPDDTLVMISLREEVSNELLQLDIPNTYCMDSWSYEEMFYVVQCLHKIYGTCDEKSYSKFERISKLADEATGLAVINNYKLPESARPELHVAYKLLDGTTQDFISYLQQ